MKIFQPKLLRISKFNHSPRKAQTQKAETLPEKPKQTKEDLDLRYLNESNKIKYKHKLLNDIEEDLESSTHSRFRHLDEKVLHFHKDPYHFLDYLVEKYMARFIESYKGEKIDGIFMENVTKIGKDIKAEMKRMLLENKHMIDEMSRLKLERQAYLDMQATKAHQDLESEPISTQELRKAFLRDATAPLSNILSSKPNAVNQILVDRHSDLGLSHLKYEILTCLKGDRLVKPQSSFLMVKDLRQEDIKDIELTRNLFSIKRNMDKIHSNYEREILSNAEKSLELEKRIFKELLDKANQNLSEMESKSKVSEGLLKSIHAKLNIEFERRVLQDGLQNLNIIDGGLDGVLEEIKRKDQFLESQKERCDLLFQETENLDKNVQKFFEARRELIQKGEVPIPIEEESLLGDSTLENLYEKYKHVNVKSYGASKNAKSSKKSTCTSKGFKPSQKIIRPAFRTKVKPDRVVMRKLY